jgi:stage V sporulation protein SpoVS
MGQKVRVALDWTPNCNHAGLAVAIERGFFAAAGLDVELVSPVRCAARCALQRCVLLRSCLETQPS